MMNEELEEEYKSIFEKPVVISVGRLTNQKAQWNLIRSFVNVRKSIPNCNLVILGQGELEKELKDYIFKVIPEAKDDPKVNILLTFQIQGGFYTYQKYHKQYDIDYMMDVLNEAYKIKYPPVE